MNVLKRGVQQSLSYAVSRLREIEPELARDARRFRERGFVAEASWLEEVRTLIRETRQLHEDLLDQVRANRRPQSVAQNVAKHPLPAPSAMDSKSS